MEARENSKKEFVKIENVFCFVSFCVPHPSLPGRIYDWFQLSHGLSDLERCAVQVSIYLYFPTLHEFTLVYD